MWQQDTIRQFWLPLLVWIIVGIIFQYSTIDLMVGDLFFQEGRFIGRHSWWANTILHKGGEHVIVCYALCLLIALAMSPWYKLFSRQSLYYLLACLIITPSIVALLKLTTNIDCPWDLSRYGGFQPYIHIFSDKPDSLKLGQCFPGGHSSGAFSLFGLYFVALKYYPSYARLTLLTVLLLGLLWSVGQWARGAHFPSHDFYSGMIGWFVAWGLYQAFFRPLSPKRQNAS